MSVLGKRVSRKFGEDFGEEEILKKKCGVEGKENLGFFWGKTVISWKFGVLFGGKGRIFRRL